MALAVEKSITRECIRECKTYFKVENCVVGVGVEEKKVRARRKLYKQTWRDSGLTFTITH